MKAQWLSLAAKFDAMKLSERWLVAIALLTGIPLLAYHFAIGPALAKAVSADQQQVNYQDRLAALQVQIADLQSPNKDPDIAARAELDKIKAQLAEMGSRLAVLEESLVPPAKMGSLLEDMVGKKSSLRLISLKTIAPQPLLEKAPDANSTNSAGSTPAPAAPPSAANKASSEPSEALYKHSVHVTLEGSYNDLTAYLERLEKAPLKLLWSSVNLSAEKHPKLVLTVIVYTLSLDRAWLIV